MTISALVSVKDGVRAAVNSAGGDTITVTPGNQVTVALIDATNVTQWSCYVDAGDYAPLAGLTYTATPGTPTNFTFTAPAQPFSLHFTTESTDGQNVQISTVTVKATGAVEGVLGFHTVKAVVPTNVGNLSAFTVAAAEATFAQGDRVLLCGQTVTSQNGIYVVGAVAVGVAALTRAGDMATGTVLIGGTIVSAIEGVAYPNTNWKLSATVTIGTTVHNWWPNTVRGQSALVAGTFTISTFVKSLTQTGLSLARVTANTSAATVQYQTSSITAGVQGTGAIVVQSQAADGSLNNADISTINWAVINW